MAPLVAAINDSFKAEPLRKKEKSYTDKKYEGWYENTVYEQKEQKGKQGG